MKAKKNLLFSLVLMLFLLCGCTKPASDGTSEKKAPSPYTSPQYEWGNISNKTLSLWSSGPETDRVYIKNAIKNYEETTGNHIQITQYKQDEFQTQVSQALSGGSEAPDLILSYGGTNIDAFDPDKNFYDFTNAPWVDDLTDTSINQTIYNGKVIGLPHWEASVSGTIYNKEIFQSYSIEVPKNQKEFLQVCKELQNHGITPLYLPFQENSMLLYQFPLDTIVEDSKVLDALNHGTLGYADIPQMETVIKWYKTMSDNGYFGKDFLKNDWDGMNEAMKSGKYAMMLCWDTWLYTDFDGDPSKFGLMPAFIGVPDAGTFEGPNLGLFLANKNSDDLPAALDFITFLADPYNYNKAFKDLYTAPVFKHQAASISTPQYIEDERLIERNYKDSIAWLRIKGFSQSDASCIVDYIQSDSITPKECLQNMERLRQERMKKQHE